MLKSVQDYRRDILGIRLKGPEKTSVETSQGDNLQSTTPLAIFADFNDLELQKPMVDKILSLFQTTPEILTSIPKEDFIAETLFIFGANKAAREQIRANQSFVFKSFSEITRNNDLKRDLWEKLKKYT